MKKFFVSPLILLFAVMLFSCQGKQGDPGPAGKDGTNGTNGKDGATGPQGPAWPSSGFANGAVKALVSGTTQAGIAFSDSINYVYANGYEFIDTGGNGNLSLFRAQFLSDGNYGNVSLSQNIPYIWFN